MSVSDPGGHDWIRPPIWPHRNASGGQHVIVPDTISRASQRDGSDELFGCHKPSLVTNKKPRTWRGLGVGFSGREQLRTSLQSLQLQGATAAQCDFTSDFRVVHTADLTQTLLFVASVVSHQTIPNCRKKSRCPDGCLDFAFGRRNQPGCQLSGRSEV